MHIALPASTTDERDTPRRTAAEPCSSQGEAVASQGLGSHLDRGPPDALGEVPCLSPLEEEKKDTLEALQLRGVEPDLRSMENDRAR